MYSKRCSLNNFYLCKLQVLFKFQIIIQLGIWDNPMPKIGNVKVRKKKVKIQKSRSSKRLFIYLYAFFNALNPNKSTMVSLKWKAIELAFVHYGKPRTEKWQLFNFSYIRSYICTEETTSRTKLPITIPTTLFALGALNLLFQPPWQMVHHQITPQWHSL